MKQQALFTRLQCISCVSSVETEIKAQELGWVPSVASYWECKSCQDCADENPCHLCYICWPE